MPNASINKDLEGWMSQLPALVSPDSKLLPPKSRFVLGASILYLQLPFRDRQIHISSPFSCRAICLSYFAGTARMLIH